MCEMVYLLWQCEDRLLWNFQDKSLAITERITKSLLGDQRTTPQWKAVLTTCLLSFYHRSNILKRFPDHMDTLHVLQADAKLSGDRELEVCHV